MDLKDYLGSQHGIGMLSTADAEGRVDAAVYSRPHVFDDGTVAFVMRDRLTHHNVGQNAHAAYLFIEEGSRLGGVRLFLRKLKEETDHDLIAAIDRARRHAALATDAGCAPGLPRGGRPGGPSAPSTRPSRRFSRRRPPRWSAWRSRRPSTSSASSG